MRTRNLGLLAFCLLLIGGSAACWSLADPAILLTPVEAAVSAAKRIDSPLAKSGSVDSPPAGEAKAGPVAGGPSEVKTARSPVAPTPRARQPGTANLRPPGTVPVLMYHYIRVNPDPADRIGYGLSVTPEDFAAQMEFLASRGYETILLQDLEGEAAKRGNAVAITFDDGYADAYEVAYPIMRRYGFKATFYLITALVGRPRYMSWEQIRELADEGNAVGSHTVRHPDLQTLDAAAVQAELRDSRAEIERQIGRPVPDLCYPSGSYDGAVKAAAGEAGYARAVTTQHGWYAQGVDALAMPRVRVSGGTSLAGFADLIGESAP